MATMSVGMLLASAMMGMIRTSHSKRVVSIANVAGSSEGAILARNDGKKNHAQAPTTILPTNSMMKKIPAMRVSVRAVLILIFNDAPLHNREATVLPEWACYFGVKKLYNFYHSEVDDGAGFLVDWKRIFCGFGFFVIVVS